jgi:hypothetical protein
VDIDGDTRILDGDTIPSVIVDMGADEVACTDMYRDLVWNSDGVVNYLEFEKFSRAWMTYDPNNPLCDPNHPNFEHDPNSINYISQTDKERFNPVCDLDQDLDVDLADLRLFAEDWLWTACWRRDIREGVTGGMIMAMAAPSMEGLTLTASENPASIQPASQLDRDPIAERGVIAMILDDVNRSIESGHPNQEGLVEIREFLIECVKDIEKSVRLRKSVENNEDLLYNQ